MNINLSLFALLLASLFAPKQGSSQTIVFGDVSGTWDLAGSPYLFIEDCTVQTGTELSIEPGVEVVMSDSVSLNVYGKILAVGTESQPIIFRAVEDTVKYHRIHVRNGSSTPGVSEFRHCEFRNGETGLYLHAFGRIFNAFTTMQTIVSDCRFDSSVTTAIYVRAQGKDYSQFMTPRRGHAKVNPIINACTFEGNAAGIELFMQGDGGSWFSNGNTEAIIQNNVFLNVQGAAINMVPGAGPSHGGTPLFVNNTIINCDRGIWIQDDDFDATTINNIFFGTSTAMERTGSSSSATFYNCFFGNTADFAGYPASYGNIVLSNVNGDPCDIGFNIFQDPLFVSANDYHLLAGSPCLGAGIDSIENNSTWHYAPITDIDGGPRPNPEGSRPDMGASESELATQLVPPGNPLHLSLGNHPNPFALETIISFEVPKRSVVELFIYDLNGKLRETMVKQALAPGYHEVIWNANNYSPGVYFYQVTAGQFSATGKAFIVK